MDGECLPQSGRRFMWMRRTPGSIDTRKDPERSSTEAKRLAALQPIPSYIQPKAEVVKARSEQYEAHLDFPVGKSVILPDFMNNQTELRNIREMFNKIQNDKKLTVTGVYIEGFASPEGPLKLNEQLSKSRAEALKTYLVHTRTVPGQTLQCFLWW